MVGLDRSHQGKLLLSALIIIGQLYWYWRGFSIGLLLILLFLLWRFICVRSLNLWVITFLCSGLFVIRQLTFTQQLQQEPQISNSLHLRADQLKLNGDLLSGPVKMGQQHVFVYLRLKQQSQQQLVKQNNQPLDIQLTALEQSRIMPATNQGEFDFAEWAAHRKMRWQVTADVETITSGQIRNFSELLSSWRLRLRHYFDHFPQYTAFHLRSLLIGMSDAEDQDTQEILSSMGMIHLFALSGLQLDFLLRILRRLAAYLHLADEGVRLVLALLLPVYVLFVGVKIGLLRAVILYLLRQYCLFRRRHLPALDSYALTLLICLWIQPGCLMELGPQLSFALTLAIRVLPRSLPTWRRQLRLSYLSMLLIVFHTYTFNGWSYILALICLPLLTRILLPITLINLLVPLTSTWSEKLRQLFYPILFWLNQKLSLQLILGALPLVVFLLCLLIYFNQLAQNKWRWRQLTAILLPLTVAFFSYRLPFTHQVTLLDIGQGDSILIRSAFPRRTILIDTGGRLQFDREDWQKTQQKSRVEKITLPYLYSLGIDQLDLVLLSHQDADHIGDLRQLLAKLPVKTIGFTKGMQNNPKVQQQLKASQFPNHYWELLSGNHFKLGQVDVQVVAPAQAGIGENEDSLTVLLTLAQKRWLFTGDLDQKGEAALLQRWPQLQADFLKVGHHGSKTSSLPQFIKQLHLQAAFISAGRHNRYHHPHPETLQTLREAQVPFLSTAQYGMIIWSQEVWSHQSHFKTKLTGEEGFDGQKTNKN